MQQEPFQLFAHHEQFAGKERDDGMLAAAIKPDWRVHLASDAEQVVWRNLESLARSGALAILTEHSAAADSDEEGGGVRDAGVRDTDDAVRIELCLRGRRGIWRRHALLGPGDARRDRFAVAFGAICRRAASFAADSEAGK